MMWSLLLFLRKSLSRQRVRVGEVVYGTGVLTVAQVIIAALAFLVQVYAAKNLGQAAFGEYRYATALLAVFSVVTLGGINTALTKSVAQGYEGSLQAAFWARAKYGLFAAAAAGLLGVYYMLQGNATLSSISFIIACGVPLVDTLLVAEAFVLGKSRFAFAGLFQVVVQGVVVCMVFAGLLFGVGVVGLFILYVLSLVASRGCIFLYTRRKLVHNNLVDAGTIAYGKKLSWFPMLGLASGHADKVLVFNALGSAELGIYSLALAPINQIVAVLKNINVVLFPRIARAVKGGRHYTTRRTFFLLLGVLCVSSVLYWISAPALFHLVLPEYAAAVPITRFLVLSVPPLMLARYYQNIYFAEEQLTLLNTYNIVSPIVQILCLYAGFALYGVLGVAYGYVLSKYLGLLLIVLLHLRLRVQAQTA